MALLGNLLGGLTGGSRRMGSGGGGMWSRGLGQSRGYSGRGYGRARSSGLFGGSLGRMAMGGVSAYLMRSFMNRRYR